MSTAVAIRNPALAAPDNVTTALLRPDREQQLMALLGDSIGVDRFRAIVLHSINRNQDLQKCSLESVLDAIRISATLRLEPTGILGEGYLINYGGKAQFEPGYRGLMKLARRSGQVDAIDAHVVYENDQFHIQYGTEPRIDHVPSLEGERGKYKGAYSWARLASGELVTDWLPYIEIEKVRKVSRNGSGSSSPWVNWWDQMALKTTLKRLMKRLPLGADAALALRVEAEADQSEPVRRPSAAVTAIHKRLGIAPDETDAAASASAVGEATETEASGATPEVVKAAAPDALCFATSPFDGDEIENCGKPQGHEGAHKSASASWPQK